MIGRLLAAAAVLWAVMLPAAAYAASQPAGRGLWHPFALAIYGLGSAICHQRADRSFHLWAAQLPVCARCTGIYLGAAIAAVAPSLVGSGFSRILFSRILGLASRDRAVGPMLRLKAEPTNVRARLLLALAGLPTLLTLVYEWTTGNVPANWIRAATGLVLGAAVCVAVLDEVGSERRPRSL